MLNVLKKIAAVPQKVVNIPFNLLNKITGNPDYKKEKKKTMMNGVR